MYSFKQIQGIIHGSRVRLYFTFLSFPLVGMCLGYRDAGYVPFTFIFLIPILMANMSIANLLNALFDFESKIDEKETSSDRTMFDYDLTSKDIWNVVYFDILLMFSFSFLAFSHFNNTQMIYVFMYLCFDIFLAIAYNVPPFRLKTKLFGGEISGLLLFMTYVNLSYFLITGVSNMTICFTDFPGIILPMWAAIANFYIDSEEDKKDGSTSSAILFANTSIPKILIIGLPTMIYLLTIIYAIRHNNVYSCLPLLTIPMKFNVVKYSLQKKKLGKKLYFKSILLFNVLSIIGIIF
ncbi:hypothetical protein CYY_008015 [Polysphondylium violaceum]|uniref:UbiA prenyltransferase family protein n=1 Tax=Polysphondylium violaceum TaxID=133409 RepID=A0A8J4PPJ7_9MYCE|nr:hypothetical protein CYY_008015 [Polysphondylium violaceum]